MIRVRQLCRFISAASCAFALLVLAGCGSGPVANNFAKVKTGMSPKEVEDLLGAPKESLEMDPAAAFKGVGPKSDVGPVGLAMPKISVRYWEESDKGYVVQFQNDKVTVAVSGTKNEMKGKMKKV